MDLSKPKKRPYTPTMLSSWKYIFAFTVREPTLYQHHNAYIKNDNITFHHKNASIQIH